MDHTMTRRLTALLLIALASATDACGQQATGALQHEGRSSASEPAPAAQPESSPQAGTVRYAEREFSLPTASARPQGLDVLEVRVEGIARRPLVLLTHGTSNSADDRAHVTPWAYLGQALWFARRGYVALVVVRNGYGRSGGVLDGHGRGCSQPGSFREIGEESARELKDAIAYMTTQPEVDPTHILSVGVSTGGFAQAALSADPPPGLRAAISFAGGRGGDGKGGNCDLDGVTAAFRAYGKKSCLPMLWLYAENDKWFPPEMASRFDQAFRQGGGHDELVMVPPDGEDGHGYFNHPVAWSEQVEEFLRSHDMLPVSPPLPPPPLPRVTPPERISAAGQQAFRAFLAAGPYKAFATTGAGGWGYASGRFSQQLADEAAIASCNQANHDKASCKVVNR